MRKNVLFGCLLISAAYVASVSAYANSDAMRSVDIPAGEMSTALQRLAQQTGVEFVYSVDQVKGLRTSGLHGEYTVHAAVMKLLEGTQFTAKMHESGAMLISASTTATHTSERVLSRFTTEDERTERGSPVDSASQMTVAKSDTSRDKLDQVVVTAQKRTESLQKVPISISVVKGDNLDHSSFTDLLDAVATVPGVTTIAAYGIGSGTLLNIRGVGSHGVVANGSSPIGYYLDSVPFSLIRNPVVPDLSVYDLERVEVLRGPQGTLYGNNSVNGLVRVLTKDADLKEFGLKARASLSSTNDGAENYNGDVAINLPVIEGKLAARAVLGYQSSGGWIDGPSGTNQNDGEVRNYRLKVNAQPTDAFAVGLSAWTKRSDAGAPNEADDAGRVTVATHQPLVSDFDAYTAKLSYDFSSVSVVSMSSYFHSFVDTILDGGTISPINYQFKSNILSEELLLNSRSDDPWKWTLGAFYRDAEETTFQAWPGVLAFPVDMQEHSKSRALFGQIGRRFWNREFEWTLGLRYFKDELQHEQGADSATAGTALVAADKTYNATTPRAVLTWYPSNEVTVYGSYGEGFRSGITQNYFLLIFSPTFPDAKPDKLRNYEVGAKVNAFDGRLSLDAASYYMDWRDVQEVLCVPTIPGRCTNAIANGTSASGIGVDLSLVGRVLQGLELGLTASWNNLENDEEVRRPDNNAIIYKKGDRFNLSAEYTLGASAAYTFPLANGAYRGSVSLSANYSSGFTRTIAAPVSPIYLSSDELLIGRARFSVSASDRWTAALFVDNFSNEGGRATPPPNASTTVTGRLQPRTVGVQFEYNY